MMYLYLHGFCSSPNSYKAQFFRHRFAEQGIELQVPDLNVPRFEQTTLSSQLDLVGTLIEAGRGPVVVIGSSLGGYLATLLAERYPQIECLLLMAPAFQFVTRYFQGLGEPVVANWRQSGWLPVYHYGVEAERMLHWGFYQDAGQHDQRCPSRDLPALVFHGLQDETVPHRLTLDYLCHNRQARAVLMHDDHGLGNSVEFMWSQMRAFLDDTYRRQQ